MRPFTNKSGTKINMMTLVSLVKKDKKHRPYYLCRCECGVEKTVRMDCLVSGNTKSCRCFSKQIRSRLSKEISTTHGGSKTRLYRIWAGIRYRSGRVGAYKDVSVCSLWKNYEPFRDWAIKSGYSDNLTIDRVNPSGNYEPENCRWVSIQDQQTNRRKTIYAKYGGRTVPLSKIARACGLKYYTLWHRHKVGDCGERLIRPSRVNSYKHGGKLA